MLAPHIPIGIMAPQLRRQAYEMVSFRHCSRLRCASTLLPQQQEVTVQGELRTEQSVVSCVSGFRLSH